LKLKMMLVIAGLALFAISSGSATAGNGDKVTGGGQVLIDTETERGAGSTLAYTAQGTTTTAKGRVTFIDRSGAEMTKFKGIVDCVEVTDNYGIVGGYRRGDEGQRFDLRVVDMGEPGRGADMIVFEEDGTNDVECGDEEAENAAPTALLARGNAQVRDGDTSNPPAEESQQASALSFLGF
jgi:hypothetical protein